MDKTFQSYNNTLVIHLSTYGKSDSHFTATAKLQLAEDMCYDAKDRGYSYVGNVNFTRAFEPCLPWAEMTNCSYNSFNSPTHGGSNNTLLEGNFCRNPDQVMGMMPWCYTGKENCERNYCDPCLVGTVYDTDEDCDKDEDCEDHIDRSLDGCAKTCGFDMSSYGAKSKASDISCGPPPEVEGGHVSQGGGQSKYKVGSKVTYKCDKSDVTRDRVCLTSGEWNPMGFVCDVPTLRWHFDKSSDVYYGVSSDDVSFTEAKESCNSLGGDLATVKDGSENTFLQHLINRRTWVPIAYSKATNDWALGDESPLEWSNWDSSLDESRKRNKCATMDTDGIWTDTNCHTKSSYVCKVSEVPICADFWDGCQRLHQDNPAMCVDFEDFANRMCPQTCGKCAIDSAVVCDVNVPSNGIASVETESIPLGGVVKFACQDSYVIASGDTVRGCMLSGELSGKPLRCIKECPKGWVYSGPSDQCYVYVDEMLNYHEATKKCASMNATLAKPSTEEENINLMVARNGSNDVWIGLDDTQTGDYLWSDGSLPEWFNWGRNEPGGKSVQNAAYVTAAGKWRSVMCKEVMQLVCQVPYISTPISEHNIVCAGRGSLDIDCGRGREIRVTKANFGRLRRDICPFGYTHNTNCTTTKAFDIISEECNGQSQCYMEAGRHVFGDPCPGIYKYTEVDYDCVPEVRTDKRIEWIEEEKARKEEKEKVVDIVLDQVTGTFCRNENVNIRCENGLIHIVGAEFGRRSKTQCAYGWPPNSPGLRNTSCGDPEYATAIVKKMCQGIDECSLFAPGLLGDPCPGINKYTVVNYTCLEESRHAEWNEWSKYGECSVSCGQGVRTRRRACESSTSLSDGDGCFGVGEEHEPCLMPPCEDVIEKTACRNQRINLKCDRGLLHIVRAEYGRRSKTMCAYGVPKNSVSISNTNCGDAHTATAIMRVKCEGKTACSVFAPGTLGDPCPGINKYSMINYTCVVQESRHAMWSVWSDYSECSVTCGMGVKSRYRECTAPSPSVPKDCIGNEAEQEPCLKTLCQSENEHQGTFCRNENINLSCKKGRLHIVSAEYGRRSKKVCSFGWPPNSKSLANTNCGDVLHATVIMKEKCEGKNRCSVFAPGLLGDPCPGINKYTVVNYTCKE